MDLIEYIRLQKCPYCDDKRTFRCLAAHTSHVHGVTGYELREQAGLNRSASICSLEHAQIMRGNALSRDQEMLVEQLTRGRAKNEAMVRRFKRLGYVKRAMSTRKLCKEEANE